MAEDDLDDLSVALLAALSEAPVDAEVAVARLTKRLGLGASALLRKLSLMSDASIGGTRGPGWVTVAQRDGRWVASLTDAGRNLVARHGAIATPPHAGSP